MKSSLRSLATRTGQQLGAMQSRLRHALLVPAVALVSHPAFAELPKLTQPTEGVGGTTVAQGDWLGGLGAYFKIGITIFGLVLAGLAFIYVVSGALGKWKQYSAGRIEVGDLKEYFIVSAVMTVFIVGMVTYAIETIK